MTLALGACFGDNAPQTPEDALPDAPTGLCETDNGGCDTLTTCSDNDGIVTCGDCPTGYTGTGTDGCDDINECDTDNGGCAETCINNEGGFECSNCLPGYNDVNGDGTECVDINECDTDNGGCAQHCANGEGTFMCSCDGGYTLNQDGLACDDIDECAANNGGCGDALLFTCDNNEAAPPTCGCAVPSMCDGDWMQVYGLGLPTGIVNWDNSGQISYAIDNASTVGTFDRVGYFLRLDNTYVWTDVPAFTANAAQLGVPIDWIWDIPLTDITIVTNSGNLTSLTGGTGNMEFWPNCYSVGSGGVYDEDDNIDSNDCYGSMQIHEGGETVFAFNAWSAAGEAVEMGIGENTGSTHPDWTFTYNGASYSTRQLEVWVRRPPCLNGDARGPNGGCMLQTVCNQPVPEAFAGGNCSNNTADFADWYCQLGGYAGAASYTELTSGVYDSLYYNGGQQAVLSSCGQVGFSGYGMGPTCTGAADLECAQ